MLKYGNMSFEGPLQGTHSYKDFSIGVSIGGFQ